VRELVALAGDLDEVKVRAGRADLVGAGQVEDAERQE